MYDLNRYAMGLSPYLSLTQSSRRAWNYILAGMSSGEVERGKINHAKRAQQRHAQKKRVAKSRAKAKRVRKQKQRQRRNKR